MLGRADGQVAWARYHRAAGDTARARAAATDALALAAAPDQPLVSLAAHRLLGEIETAAGHRLMAAEHLAAALDLATACDAPFERALTLLALAQLRLATGVTDEAASLLDEVRDICGPLGAAPTLARVDALAARLTAEPLSPALSRRPDVARGGRAAPPAARTLQRRDRRRSLRQPPHRADPPLQPLRASSRLVAGRRRSRSPSATASSDRPNLVCSAWPRHYAGMRRRVRGDRSRKSACRRMCGDVFGAHP